MANKIKKIFGISLALLLLAGISVGISANHETGKAGAIFSYEIEKSGSTLKSNVAPHNIWKWSQWRNGVLVKEWYHTNLTTTEGRTHMLNTEFHGGAAEATWYIMLFESDSTPLESWTYDLLADSLVTECTAYDEANRVAYNEAEAAAASMTNSANKATFTMNDTKTIYGACLVSLNTKSDHTAGDYVYSAGTFGTAASVESGDVLKITLVLSLSDV